MQEELRTTDGVIALRNLQAQVASLERLAPDSRLDARGRGDLVDLLALRGQILGRAEDTERARSLAEAYVKDRPDDGPGWIRLARMYDTYHQFADALLALDRAERLGVPTPVLTSERALALHHLGHVDEALRLARAEAVNQPGFTSFATLAVLHAERGEPSEAECYFDQSKSQYRSVSPFPIAHLELLRGKMWLRLGDVPKAQYWFEVVIQRLPGHSSAQECLTTIRDSARWDAPVG